MHRRTLIQSGVALATVLGAPSILRAQDAGWPARSLRLIVPFPPGGSTDGMARIIAPKLEEVLGRKIQIENKGGQGGGTGAVDAAKAAPDGYTWLLCYDSQATNEHVLRLPFKTMDAFAPASLVATGPLVLVANPAAGFRSWSDVVSAAKAKPGELTYATSAAGGLAHVATVMASKLAGADLTHVPYRGGAPALADVLAGKVPLFMSNVAVVAEPLRSGKVVALGVTSRGETRHVPGVKSFAETGATGLEALTWWCLMTQARVPEPIIRRMNEAMNSTLQDPGIRAQIDAQGADVRGGSVQDAANFMTAEIDKWGQVIADNGITAES